MSAHGHRSHAPAHAAFAILTISDTRVSENDQSGTAARRLIETAGHRVAAYRIVPDDAPRVAASIAEWLASDECDAIVTNGGTGVGKRDRTYEALAGFLDLGLPGFGELFRMLSWGEVGSAAMLSRALGGIAQGKPIFALPGSPQAVELALERLILPEIGHLLAELRK